MVMAHYSWQLTLVLSIYLLALFALQPYHSLPLSTHKRWIIDESTGQRVKLRCVSWVAHLHLMLAEGLDKQPIAEIVSQVLHHGFNCVRLTWATFMFTRYANHTIVRTLDALGLKEAKVGIAINNPFVLNMTHLEAFDLVINELGARGLMVVSNNHVSEPTWCCGPEYWNSFFGDKGFETQEWLHGLSLAAQFSKGKSQVVAISLRNEIGGAHQDVDAWYKNITQAVLTVHQANPNMLVMVPGLNADSDLSFIRQNGLLNLSRTLNNKVVYEVHSFRFRGGEKQSCDETIQDLNDKAGFLTSGPNGPTAPLFISSFGIDLLTQLERYERWLTCLVSYLAGADLDWGWWTLQGSYYLRQGRVNTGEPYGILNYNWDRPSYPQFRKRFQLLLKKIQDPSSKLSNSCIMFHPQSGKCIQETENNQIEMSDCESQARWRRDGANIKLLGTQLCLKANGEGLPVTLSDDCLSQQSSWSAISRYGLLLATLNGYNGKHLCLQKDDNSSIILTRRCICVGDDPWCLDNTQMQWFQLVSTNV